MVTESYKLNNRSIVFRKENHTLILVNHGLFVLAVRPDIALADGQPFIPLAKVYDDGVQAQYDWVRIIGKMTLKEVDSKYFGNPRLRENLSNGNVQFDDYARIIDIAKDVIDLYNKSVKSVVC